MRRALLGLALLLALAATALAAGEAAPGQSLIERLVTSVTGGAVRIYGLGGSFPYRLTADRLEIADQDGAYLTVTNLKIAWSPLRLIRGEFAAETVTADDLAFDRLPVSSAPAQGKSSGFSLPVTVSVKHLTVSRIDIAAAIVGAPATLALEGALSLASLDQAEADLTVRSLADEAVYRVRGKLDQARIAAAISVREPPQGLIARIAKLPDLGAIALDARLDGPRDAVGADLALAAGSLRAGVKGSVDLTHHAADLALAASAPAMRPAPGISWQSVALDATVRGPWTAPAANGTVRIAALEAAGAGAQSVAIDLAGDTAAARLRATLAGLRIPGPKPDLLAAAPLVLDASAQLKAAGRPVNFDLSHPLIAVKGRAETEGALKADATVRLPALAPFGAVAGVDLAGSADLLLAAEQADQATSATLDATLSVTGGLAPIPGLIGNGAKLALAGTVRGQDVALSRFSLEGKSVTASATGGLSGGGTVLALDWKAGLSDLSVLSRRIEGVLDAQGHAAGPIDDVSLTATLAGKVAAPGIPSGPLSARVEAQHLPAAPSGSITAEGALAGAPLALAASATRNQAGALHVAIEKADWKSAHAQGALDLPQGATLPLGNLDARITRLDDLRPFLGEALSGSIAATLATAERGGKNEARLTLDATGLALPGAASIARANLQARIADPTGAPVVDGTLTADGIATQGAAGSARLTVSGPETALAARLAARVQNLAGADASLDAATTVDAKASTADLARLDASWKGESLRLLAPVRIGFGGGLTLGETRLALGQAVLTASGRAAPTLDLTLALRNVTPDLLRPFDPTIDAAGTLRADARLTGTTARPAGTIRVEATGLHMRTGPGQGLPPAALTAAADLAGESARIDARLAAGRLASLTVNGTAPLGGAGALALRAGGGLDLAMLNPIVGAAGRRLAGRLAIDAGVSGTLAAPRLSGTTRLSAGAFEDFGQGVRLTNIEAEVALEGEQVRIARFTGRAGAGTIGLAGTVGVFTPDQAVSLTVTATDASPISSTLLTATLDANLAVTGALKTQLALGGSIHLRRADITIPDRFPPNVATLHVIRPGQPPPKPPAPGPTIGLNLTLSAPREIFVRGHGVFAELGGELRLTGTSTNPQPLGSFTLRQGQFSIAGQTLTFTEGEVSFNGGSLADPSLHFVASSTNGTVTAMLTIGGTASAPKITLSSTPELPQDEVLAQLLFKRGTSSLSPFELASIAAALAEITGVGPNVSNPLESLRKDLGLDRLTIGSSANGNPTLQAGRYVAPGVFVGARQGTNGNSTQGLVQVDLWRGVKLEGTVGTGTNTTPGATPADSAGSSIGLTYQFQY